MTLQLSDAVLLASAVVFVIWYLYRSSKPSQPLPPGPKPLPLFGNLFNIPRDNAHLVYREWSKSYGSDIVHASVPGTEIVVLNSAWAVDAVMNKRSTTCSDRPPMTGARYIGMGDTMGNLHYNHELRAQRKAYHVHLSPNAVQAYEPVQARAIHSLLFGLQDTPAKYREHLRQMTGEIIIAIAYGIEAQKSNDPYIALGEDGMMWVSRSLQFEGMVLDMFPLLQRMPSWVPGAGFKRASVDGKRVIDKLKNKPFQVTKETMAAGAASPSVVFKMLEENASDEFAKLVASTMYITGADTTVSALFSFFLAMVINPGAQKKAQAELDSVLGGAGSRLPKLADAPHLPYVDALVDELLRWHPVAPLGVPHACKTNEIVDGYLIPAGATIFANLYAILHDPALFPDPDAFKPEHHLPRDQGGSLPEDADVPGSLREIPFSVGRRICPGRHLARPTVWLAVASVLTVYEILPAKDAEGKDIKVEEKYEDGLVSSPAPFPCEIRVRSDAAGALLRAMGV